MALGTAIFLTGGCSVERTIAVVRIDSRADDAGSFAGDASFQGTADARSDRADDSSSAQAGSEGGAGSSCEHPAFVTSSTGGIWHNGDDGGQGGYLVFNNVWNTAANPGPQTLYACSYHSWYVISDQNNDAGVVESYPNVQMNFNDVPLSSLQAVTMRRWPIAEQALCCSTIWRVAVLLR